MSDDRSAAERVEANLAVLREERRRGEAAAREHLIQYVENRRKAYEAFASVSADAEFTQQAKQRLEKAERDLAELEAYFASDWTKLPPQT